MLRIPAVFAACIAVVLVASACTDDKPKPNFSSVSTSPTPTTSPTPSASAEPTDISTTGPNVGPGELPPTPGPGADQQTQEGALAFAAYYFRMSDWAFATSNFAILDPFFSASCSQCTQAQANLKSLLANGQYFIGGRITTNSVGLAVNDARSGAQFAVTGMFAVAAAELRSADGAVVRTEAADPAFQLTDWLMWTSTGWQIVDEAKA